MSERTTYKLGDISKIVGGGTPSTTVEEYWNGDIPWLTPRDLTNYTNRYIERGERNISEVGLRNSSARLLPKGTVLLTSRAPIGYLAIAANQMCTNQGFKSFVVDETKVDNEFLYYLLLSNVKYLKSLGTGTTFSEVSGSALKDVEFTFPTVQKQKEIASILSSLDDKIELNLQMNQTLEAMAQAIFKEWFVNFNFPGFDGELVDGLPKGWMKATLRDVLTVRNGYAFKGTDFINDGVPVIKIKNVKPNRILINDLSFVSREVADLTQKYRIKKDDILITMSGNRIDGTPETWVGKVAMFNRNGEYLLNQRVSILDLKEENKRLKYYLTLLLSSQDLQYFFITNATSSGGQANISPDLIYKTEFVLPEKSVVDAFFEFANSVFEKMNENELANDSLVQTRNILLPKLMTGKIEIQA